MNSPRSKYPSWGPRKLLWRVERDHPDIRINVYVGKTETMVYLDLSGGALHQRGYHLYR